jgi:hypothetical protein
MRLEPCIQAGALTNLPSSYSSGYLPKRQTFSSLSCAKKASSASVSPCVSRPRFQRRTLQPHSDPLIRPGRPSAVFAAAPRGPCRLPDECRRSDNSVRLPPGVALAARVVPAVQVLRAIDAPPATNAALGSAGSSIAASAGHDRIGPDARRLLAFGGVGHRFLLFRLRSAGRLSRRHSVHDEEKGTESAYRQRRPERR